MAKTVKTFPPLPATERGQTCHINAVQGGRIMYCNGSNVIWRAVAPMLANEEKPEDVFTWKGHTRKTTVAAMTTNGQWCCSGDVTGELRVWGAKGDNIEKGKYKLWDGPIKDAGWSSDHGRIVAAGDGKEVRAAALIWDTGAKTGDVGGHSKAVSSISFRNQRPFRVATGGEDFLVGFHEGPPFKFTKSNNDHTNFVNCVRFSPDGEFFATCGSDSLLQLFAGKEGDKIKEMAKPDGMSGSLFQLTWSPDSKFIATAGGDKKFRVWSVEAGAQVSEVAVGDGSLDCMLLGVSWVEADKVVGVTFDGTIMFWKVDPASGQAESAGSHTGTQGPLTSVAVCPKTNVIVQGSSEGNLAVHLPAGTQQAKIGKSVQHIIAHSPGYGGPDDSMWVISLDDNVRKLTPESGIAGPVVKVPEKSLGAGWLDAEETRLLCCSTRQNLHCVNAEALEWSRENIVERQPTAFGILPGQKCAIGMQKPEGSVGGVQSTSFVISLFNIKGNAPDAIEKVADLDAHVHEVACLKFNQSGTILASGDASKQIFIWDIASATPTKTISDWMHNARVTSMAWMPDGNRLVTASLDANISVWNVAEGKKTGQIDRAHKGGVTAITATGDNTFASVGADGFAQVYEIA